MEDLFDEIDEKITKKEKIQEVMDRSYGFGEFDKEGLMNELNELNEELAEHQLSTGLCIP